MPTAAKPPRRRSHAPVTIIDVARHAGVSSMTVSRVINNDSRVSDATRDGVLAAVAALGYSPNKAARSLARGSQIRIGLLYTNPSASYLNAMLLGVLEQARQSDTSVVVVECGSGGPAALKTLRDIIRDGIDGILLVPPMADFAGALDLLKRNRTPTVTMGTQRPDLDFPSVGIDEYHAARAMTEHLLALGHRRIGLIKGSPDHSASARRLEGFLDALHDAGIVEDPLLVVDGDFSYRSGLDAADRLLSLPRTPTAIFASNDDMAAAVIATASRHGIAVPGQLTVCGFDDTLLATCIWPDITTVRQPIADMAHAAIQLLERTIRARRAGTPLPCEHLVMDFDLVRRHSDAPPADSAA